MPANSDASLTKRWYVVQAQPGREQLALVHLARQSFEGFCPTRLKTRRSGHKHVKVKAPFFPGYLFVSLDVDCERWRSINGTIGVMRLVAFGSGGRPTPLPGGFVERLHELNGGNCSIADELRAGDRVRVISGPLDDLCGVLESASEHERVTILLSVLGKETRVSLRRGSLIAA
jgi:transcription elongation factor/antiterminator RfaH